MPQAYTGEVSEPMPLPTTNASFEDEKLTQAVNPLEWWTVHQGAMPIVATAIHNGHEIRPAVAECMSISHEDRLREEDPFTEFMIRDVPNRIVFHRSRFEVDLNRARNQSVYLTPEQAWGLEIWKGTPATEVVDGSCAIHDAYYAMLKQVLEGLEQRHGRFIVLDVHSYNHRRGGPEGAFTEPANAPEINIGTHSMDRDRWAHMLEPFIDRLRSFEFRGRKIDVRENIAFQGKGEQTRFVHSSFAKSGCAIAIEFKKFFMDEWTGIPDREALYALRTLIRTSLPYLIESLRSGR